MKKCAFGRFWRWKLKTGVWFQRFRKILLFFGRNAGISRVFKGWIRRRTCNVDAVLQVRLHYLYVETSVWKSKGMHPCFERNSRFWGLNHVKPWVGQFRATTANPRGLMRKCGFGRFWRWKLKTHLWFQRFRKIFVVFWKNAGISRVFKGWIRRRICNVDAVLQGRLHYLYVETNVWKK